MNDPRHALGAAGEAAARRHLEKRGYRILDHNVRAGGVELDLVAERGGVLVFVEVKTRSSARHGSAAEAVDARKQARIARGAAAWLRETRRRARAIRFDVVTCERDAQDRFRITHWKAAFETGD